MNPITSGEHFDFGSSSSSTPSSAPTRQAAADSPPRTRQSVLGIIILCGFASLNAYHSTEADDTRFITTLGAFPEGPRSGDRRDNISQSMPLTCKHWRTSVTMANFQRSFINTNAVQIRRAQISDPRFAPLEFIVRDQVFVASSPSLNPGAGAATLFVIGHLRTNPSTAAADDQGRVVLNVEVEQPVNGLARPEPIVVRVRLYRGRAFKNRGTTQWIFRDSRVLVSGPLLRAQSATLETLLYMDATIIGLIPDWVEIEQQDTIYEMANSLAAATPLASAASGPASALTNGVVSPPPTVPGALHTAPPSVQAIGSWAPLDFTTSAAAGSALALATSHGIAVSAPPVVGAAPAPHVQAASAGPGPQAPTQASHGNQSGGVHASGQGDDGSGQGPSKKRKQQ